MAKTLEAHDKLIREIFEGTLLAERQKRLAGVLKDHWNLAVSTGTAAS